MKKREIAHKEQVLPNALVVGLCDTVYHRPYIEPLLRTTSHWRMPSGPGEVTDTITLGQPVYVEDLPVHIRLAYRVLSTVWELLYDAAIEAQPPLENWTDLDMKREAK